MSIAHFRELDVWQLSMALVKDVYQLTDRFPADQRFGLTSQIQRAAVSIPSNIAEGNARGMTRDYARFVSMALGSSAELQTQLLIARDLGFADDAALVRAGDVCQRVGRMLLRLRQALTRHANTAAESRHPGVSEPDGAATREPDASYVSSPESRVPSPEHHSRHTLDPREEYH